MPVRVAKSVAKTVATVKVASKAGKTAKKGAKAFAGYKVVKFVGKGGKKLLIIPIAAGGGLAAYKKLTSGSTDEPATPYGSPVGPAATSSTVTPPKTPPGSTAEFNGESSMSDKTAGTETAS
jgi:hypothetical protein